jgi:hypothetical protein
VNREELLKRSGKYQHGEKLSVGTQIVLWVVVLFVYFAVNFLSSLAWLPPAEQVEEIALAEVKRYLSGRVNGFEKPSLSYHTIEFIKHELKIDYLDMLTSGCSGGGRRSCLHHPSYDMFVSFLGDGQRRSGHFQIIQIPDTSIWKVVVR